MPSGWARPESDTHCADPGTLTSISTRAQKLLRTVISWSLPTHLPVAFVGALAVRSEVLLIVGKEQLERRHLGVVGCDAADEIVLDAVIGYAAGCGPETRRCISSQLPASLARPHAESGCGPY